jgi:hypothetical protein
MSITHLIREFAITGAVALAVSAFVAYMYALTVHGAGLIDWETSVRLALTLGIVIPLAHRRTVPSGTDA